jgi:BirA family biotin operon repressor/biotin-[acetyl-CoA-carboxylase] ligase
MMPENPQQDLQGISERLEASLQSTCTDFPVFVVAETESTNTDLLRLDYQANSTFCALLAINQSGGRGRQGRAWQSDEGSLTFSVRWQFKRSAATLSGLSLAVAVATLAGLESLGVTGVAIKWPNDLLIGTDKLGGILLEIGKPLSDGLTHAVIGIGINIGPLAESSKTDLKAAALLEDLKPEQIHKQRETILVAILEYLIPTLIQFDEEGFAAFRQNWMRKAAWLGERVILSTGTKGTLIGVDQDGALLLETELCIERFLSGDISLRPAAL